MLQATFMQSLHPFNTTCLLSCYMHAQINPLLHNNRSDAEVQASAQFAKLRSSYEQVDLDAWVPYIDQAVTTANAINAMRTPATNPFTITLKTLTGVVGTIEKIRGGMLTDLSTSVEHFNGLWHNNASVAFQVSAAGAASSAAQ